MLFRSDTDPDFLKSYESLARLYLSRKDPDKAVSQYKTILKKNPDLASPHMMLGTIYEMKEKYDTAAGHYRKALENNPDFAPAANNLAYYLADRTENYDEALQYARKAKALLPEDPGVMDTLGLAFYKKELYGNAAGQFLDSLKEMPEHPTVNYHLGLTYHKQGKVQQAKKFLSKALELSDSFDGADKARKILDQLEKDQTQ